MFRVSDLDIKKLSGPVSFHYLVPKTEVFLEKAAEGIFLPIIILLGDEHFSVENRCEDGDRNTVMIESSIFWRKLNLIAKQYPIDFYLEVNKPLALSDLIFEHKGMITKILGESSGCYNTKNRISKKYQCLHPRIRWHLSDPRAWSEDKVESIVNKIAGFLLQLADNKDWDNIERLPRHLPGLEMFRAYFDIVVNAYQSNHTFEQLSLALSNMYSSFIVGNRDSLIYKQLVKYNLDINVELYSYKVMTKSFKEDFRVDPEQDTLAEYLNREAGVDDETEVESTIDSLFRYIFTRRSIYDLNLVYNKIASFLFLLWVGSTSFMLDIYFMGRLFKTPKNNINSYLTIGYFGQFHSKQISDHLTISLGWYNQVNGIPERQRCITFPHDIDLNRDLQEYAELRQQIQDITPYSDQLKLEEESRAQ